MNRSLACLVALLALSACAEDPDLSATEFAVRVLDPGTRPGREMIYEFPDGDWPTMQVVVEVEPRSCLVHPVPFRGVYVAKVRPEP